jgi:flagellar biogenesis protein FliO
MDFFGSLLKMGSSLAAVLALVVVAAAAGRRWLVPALGVAPLHTIRLAGSLSLGGRRSVLLLEVAGRTLVVGATPQNLVLLSQFETAAAPARGIQDASAASPDSPHQTDTPRKITAWHGFAEALRDFQRRMPSGRRSPQ